MARLRMLGARRAEENAALLCQALVNHGCQGALRWPQAWRHVYPHPWERAGHAKADLDGALAACQGSVADQPGTAHML